MRFINFLLFALAFCVCFSYSSDAFGLATVSISPSGDASYIVQGSGMDGVAGIQLDVHYDPASLTTPSVIQGTLVAGAMLVANTSLSGRIKIAIISNKPFSGSGQIASINFAAKTGAGGITSVTSKMINSSGATVASQATVSGVSPATTDSGAASTPGITSQQPAQLPSVQPFSAPSTSSLPTSVKSSTGSMPISLGAVTIPSDVQGKSDQKTPEKTVVHEQYAEPAQARPVEPPAEEKPAAEPQKENKVKITSYIGVIENFRTYSGAKSSANFIALFSKEIAPTIRQVPAVVLSDGKTPVIIAVKLEDAADKSPNFALSGAKLVTLNRDASAAWIIEALPQKGVAKAALTILTDSETVEYPLTVAVAVESVSTSEADFAVFLKDSGVTTPKRDLNGDGKHDYLDDFIYTANYLVLREAASKVKKKPHDEK